MSTINHAVQATPGHNLIDYELFLMGHAIFNPNQPGEQIYVVMEGEVGIMAGAQLIDTLIAGDMVREAYLRQNVWTALAKTNCQLVAIEAHMATTLQKYPPDFVVEAVQVMVGRLTRRVTPAVHLVVWPPSEPVAQAPRRRYSSEAFHRVAALAG